MEKEPLSAYAVAQAALERKDELSLAQIHFFVRKLEELGIPVCPVNFRDLSVKWRECFSVTDTGKLSRGTAFETFPKAELPDEARIALDSVFPQK